MIQNNSFNPIKSISSIIKTNFSLERQNHLHQKYPEQINDELVYILKKAVDCSDNPRYTLIKLGLIIFPGSIAIQKSKIAQLLLICKSTLETRMKNAGWNTSDVYCISTVRRCLRNIVRDDYRSWCLKSIPKGSTFEKYVNLHQEIVHCKKEIITEEEFFNLANSSQISSPIPYDF